MVIIILIIVVAVICIAVSGNKKKAELYKSIIYGDDHGDVAAMGKMADLFEQGKINDAIIKKYRREMYTEIAEKGDGDAMVWLGDISDSVKEKINWYTKAAEAGNTVGMKRLALEYSGYGSLEEDIDKEIEWYKKASDAGDCEAKYSLALAYRSNSKEEEANSLCEQILTSDKADQIVKVQALRSLGDYYSFKSTMLRDDALLDKAQEYFEKELLYTEYNIDELNAARISKYGKMRDELASAAMSLGNVYYARYQKDKSYANKVAGMYIYGMILDPDRANEGLDNTLKSIEYNITKEQIQNQQMEARNFRYVLS